MELFKYKDKGVAETFVKHLGSRFTRLRFIVTEGGSSADRAYVVSVVGNVSPRDESAVWAYVSAWTAGYAAAHGVGGQMLGALCDDMDLDHEQTETLEGAMLIFWLVAQNYSEVADQALARSAGALGQSGSFGLRQFPGRG